MKIVDDLINELTNKDIRLTDILIKTKVLAFKLKNSELSAWIDNELNGYSKSELPNYRILQCQIIGTVSNGFQRANNYPIPILGLDKELFNGFKTAHLTQSVSALDEFVNKEMEGRFIMNIPPEIYGILSKEFSNGFVVEYARREIDKVQIIQTLTAVRTKLLDFLLKLNEELGDTEDIKPLTEGSAKDKISSLFNSAVFGNNTTIIVGNYNTQNVNIVIKGNIESLSKYLEQIGIARKEIDELTNIIESDNPQAEKREFGDRVKAWVTKMIGKAMDNSWKVGLAAAGKLLADAIEIYYGWK
jgi:hypothetical protein